MAGGSGARFGGPKQYELLGGTRIIDRSVAVARASGDGVVIVVPAADCAREGGVAGGATRSESVRAGLATVPTDATIVCVHDAARPLVSKKLIDKLYISAASHGNAIPVIPVGETMRMVDGEHNYVVDRSQFRLVQTPQCFKTEMLLKSFHMVDYQNFTDDSSLYQAAGHQIHLEEGEPFNIKVTHPNDFLFAEYYLQSVERNNLKMHSYKN